MLAAGAMTTITEIGVITAAMAVSLPYTLALGVQTLEMSPESLEEQFRGLKYNDGTPVDVIFANKGL